MTNSEYNEIIQWLEACKKEAYKNSGEFKGLLSASYQGSAEAYNEVIIYFTEKFKTRHTAPMRKIL